MTKRKTAAALPLPQEVAPAATEAATAAIGHNNPPTPFDEAAALVDDLRTEAGNWLDGSKVSSQAEADAIGKLLTMGRQASAKVEAARKTEAEPFDKGKAEVQARFKPLAAKVEQMVAVCKEALAPWLVEQERQRVTLAEQARKEAEAAALAATAAVREAHGTDLEAREKADAALDEAKAIQRNAGRLENSRANIKVEGARATTLRTSYVAVVMDEVLAARHYWKTRRDEMEEFIRSLAQKDVNEGRRAIPGVDVQERKTVV